MRGRRARADAGGLVSATHTYTSPGWDGPRRSRSTLRFLGPDALSEFLAGAGWSSPSSSGTGTAAR
ncbi:hypothetical protein NKH77_08405 [Streptomyces sp. M19]